ncbi:MAG: periplasmic heavy metal sensor [Desulfobacterota bacterium]|jgi:zinc resistance-associated protein|nr:periplasmic heavy metal sensor [Thermodesulfobacteriota bacterium]
MKRYGLALAMVAIMLAAALPVMAFGPRCGQGPDGPRFEKGQPAGGCPFYDYQSSNLTDDQKAQLKKLDDEFYKKTSPIRDEMRQGKREMNTLLSSDKPDEAKIWATHKRVSSLKDQLEQERIRHQLNVKKVVPDAKFGPGKGMSRGWGQRPCARI